MPYIKKAELRIILCAASLRFFEENVIVGLEEIAVDRRVQAAVYTALYNADQATLAIFLKDFSKKLVFDISIIKSPVMSIEENPLDVDRRVSSFGRR